MYGQLQFILNKVGRKGVGLLAFTSVISSILELALIAGVMPLFRVLTKPDVLVEEPLLANLFSLMKLQTYQEKILVIAIGVIIFILVKTLIQIWILYYQNKFYYVGIEKLSVEMFKSYLNADYFFFLRENPSTIIRNIKTEIPIIFQRIITCLVMILTDGVLLLLVLSLLIYTEPIGTLIVLGLLGLINVLFYKKIKAKLKTVGEIRQKYESETIKWINQGIGGIKDLKILNRFEYFVNKSSFNYKELRKSSIYNDVVGKLPKIVIESTAIIILMLFILILIRDESNFTNYIPILTLYGAAMFKVMPAVNRLMGAIIQIRYSRIALDTVHDELKKIETYQADFVTRKLDLSFHSFQDLKLNDLSFHYPGHEKNLVLDKVNLHIPRNTSIGFIGPSGSGKTTIINILLGLIDPTNGDILVDDRSAIQNKRSWQDIIGFVPQDIYLTDDSIISNIAFGIDESKINYDQIKKVVDLARLEELIQSLSEGLDTRIGDRGTRLSGGQRQRIGIARALYHNPEVLIFDEATSALDSKTEEEITKAIDFLMHKKTIIIVAHRVSTLRNCDYIYEIKNGKINLVDKQKLFHG